MPGARPDGIDSRNVRGDFRLRRYAPILERVLWRSLRDEVPDFVQQTFLHLHRARASFTVGALFRPWLLSIAINLQREHFRRLKRRRAVHPDVFTFGSRAPTGPDVIYEAERACRAVELLPAREVLRFRSDACTSESEQ